jgi:hypothetical protein
VTFVPTPSFILLLQLSTSAIAVWALSGMGIVSTEKLEMAKAKKYMLVVACFAGFLYCNVKALQVCVLANPFLAAGNFIGWHQECARPSRYVVFRNPYLTAGNFIGWLRV